MAVSYRIVCMKTDQNERRLVVALIASSALAGRSELRGISDAARRLGWTLETIDMAEVGPDLAPYRPLLARADGVIVRLVNPLRDGMLSTLGVPLVGLDVCAFGNQLFGDDAECAKALWAEIRADSRKIAKTAADELLATGRSCFAFVPMLLRYPWTGRRGAAFLSCIRAAGADARLYRPHTQWDWVEERVFLAQWLSELPRPFGIFAGNDLLAKFALDACHSAGLDVPEDAAIVGADDDETICLTASPSLSSVRIDFEGAGRKAAEALDRLMGGRNGQALPKPPHLLTQRYGVLGVAHRASTTATDATVDPRVTAALDFISLHALDSSIGVADVARVMFVCRRQADRLFRATGKSIREHIEDVRIERVKALLRTGKTGAAEIAAECGFSSVSYLSRAFRRKTGSTLRDWRP